MPLRVSSLQDKSVCSLGLMHDEVFHEDPYRSKHRPQTPNVERFQQYLKLQCDPVDTDA